MFKAGQSTFEGRHVFGRSERRILAFALLAWMLVSPLPCGAESSSLVSLTIIPSPPVTDQIKLDVRGSIRNPGPERQKFNVTVHLDQKRPETLLYRASIEVPPDSARGFTFRWQAAGHTGKHQLILNAKSESAIYEVTQPLEVISSPARSTHRIGGAWVGIVHWSEQEAARWNDEIRRMTDEQWREVVRGMHEICWDVIVIEEVFRNQMYSGQHAIETEGYKGLAFYPSRLYPGRMEIAAHDPIEAILSEADALGMHVFMGVGLYAWFDFSAGSLDWHKRVASELWDLYGHHPSFYGWYVSEEVPGNIRLDHHSPQQVEAYRKDIAEFFGAFREHCHTLSPDKPIMLAPNCYFLAQAEQTWRQVLKDCDIVCPFGFHRMPKGDVGGEEAARWMQALCDQAGAHVWMDLEAFLFGTKNDLYPRPVSGLIRDLYQFPNFEKILCFQYPGLLNAPWASRKPGGEDTVQLFLDYKRFVQGEHRTNHLAIGKPVRLGTAYTAPYTGLGDHALTDGNIALWADTENPFWQGFSGQDVEAVIDLGEPTTFDQVCTNFLQETHSGVFLPRRVEFAISKDGQKFSPIAILENDIPVQEAEGMIHEFKAGAGGVRARYIRVRAENVKTIPDWHAARGKPAWLFVDEVIVTTAKN